MRRAVLVLAAILVACESPWIPDEFPVEVVVLSEATPDQLDAIRAAADEWSAAMGERVFRVRYRPGALSDCWQINLYVTHEGVPTDAVGYTRQRNVTSCAAKVGVRPVDTGQVRLVTTHELGHALLGTDFHSNDPGSVMNGKELAPHAYVTDADVAAVRARTRL